MSQPWATGEHFTFLGDFCRRRSALRGCYEFQTDKIGNTRENCINTARPFFENFLLWPIFRVKIQDGLLGQQFLQQLSSARDGQQRRGAQQHDGIRQEAHAPRQPETIQEHLAQAQLVLLEGLRGFNPRADLLQESAGRLSAQGQQAQQRLMLARGVSKLPWTRCRLPTTRTERSWIGHAKPMPVLVGHIAQPLQRLALGTSRLVPSCKGWHQFHVRPQLGHDGDPPLLPTSLLGCCRQIAHVGHDNRRPPGPPLRAVVQAGHQQAAFGNIGGSNPTDQWDQQYAVGIGPPPQAQRVLFVADKTAALSGLEGASSQCRPMGGVGASCFFLKPTQAAGKSVASIKATVCSQPAACSMKPWRKQSLICRSPLTPRQSRNSWSIRTSGNLRWLGKRAKARQWGCSGNRASNRLNACTGVSSASRCSRHSCAALNLGRWPRAGRRRQCSLMKSSGMCGSSKSRSLAVPVTGKRESMPTMLSFSNPCVRQNLRTASFNE